MMTIQVQQMHKFNQRQLMQNDRLNKPRLTIQQYQFPKTRSIELDQSVCQNQRKSQIVFYTGNSQKKLLFQNASNNQKKKMVKTVKLDRKSEPNFYNKDHFVSNLMNFPQLKINSNRERYTAKNTQSIKSYISTKLNVGSFRNLQKAISTKYNTKLEFLRKSQELKNKKLISINEMNGNQIKNCFNSNEKLKRVPLNSKSKKKGMKKVVNNHLNRMKDDLLIPIELSSQQIKNKQIDSNICRLQLKNMLRFEFDSNLELLRQKQKLKPIKNEFNYLNGWVEEHESMNHQNPYLL